MMRNFHMIHIKIQMIVIQTHHLKIKDVFSDHKHHSNRWIDKSNPYNSIYNIIVTTPDQREFLLKLKDFSQNSTTGDFLADQVSSIIEKVGLEKFAAFVTDSGSNCHQAREIIEHTYPHIIDMRCIAHAINLIASNFTKISSVAAFISELNKIMRKKPEIISNTQVKNLLKNDEFFFMSQTISHIINPIKDCILKLEARTALLADGYIQMLKLAATINHLPSSNTLKLAIIGI
ncbi:hypothetical protein RhiirC2_871196 [Rhizophagus irregularis]|uniref:DUF659 domain-containing protein n=1 Tax=Rhizophagus irregularis TaxID=588596 RepID=A0A2N1MDH9_9GLOM|nr:hypothetical protein RhiirC2_871196 [Rhizophagus irregularis]